MKKEMFIILLIFTTIHSFGQDTLFFQKKKNNNKKYFIELNLYKVKIKPINGKKIRAYITDFKDTTLLLSVYRRGKDTRRIIKKLQLNLYDSIQRNDLTLAQQDSAYILLAEKIRAVKYSTKKEISISSIKKITVNNYFRPDKVKIMQTVDGFGLAGLGGMLLVAPALIAIDTKFVPVFAFLYFYGVAMIPVAIITETKQINLKRTWNIINIKS